MKYQPTEHHLLPTKKQLAKSTGIAFICAVVILVTIILPAEYGIDPTRIGKIFGLTRMGEIKMQLAQEAKLQDEEIKKNQEVAVKSTDQKNIEQNTRKSGQVTSKSGIIKQEQKVIVLAPDQAIEVKMEMSGGEKVSYSWSTDEGKLNWDLHGDSFDKSRKARYSKGTGDSSDSSEFTAEFDGTHGWFWRNRTTSPVTITLNVEGSFAIIKEIK